MKKIALVLMVAILVSSLGTTVMAGELKSVRELHFKKYKKEPMVGAGLALLLPGAGHYYAQDNKGMKKFGLAELAGYSLAVLVDDSSLIEAGIIGLKAYAALDAYRKVKAYNKSLTTDFGVSLKKNQINLGVNYQF
ncbi:MULTISPECIES: hypothetical protein [unclassified Candidatus Frackibacter]|uniref:hypothetical protein n=1 Tax=unclassified Candidatus Frackibacter TaxID=2648818 RepID=UPI00088FC459|nr:MULTISPECIES: hypothetical protein [unclassified Candidatus Frackibacter]SDC31539.1 hypothetical protein SAMN04515661_106100 [Candidatus Frackibacter sp. WG11]SEM73301.1 hypothetical protein SAMN04488698_11417 [Candidatus Frackibacter sp. WG12]SFL59392.1 hypothetical protein SAMN04488699_10699 [Candidatus Frackibacter sp. WG13]